MPRVPLPSTVLRAGSYAFFAKVGTRTLWAKKMPPLSRRHSRYRTNCYPCVGCNTRNVVPPLDQTSTSASSPFATLPSSFCTSAAECTG